MGARPYLITELVRGESLDRVSKPLPWGRVLAIGIGLARGLAAAHREGVLHRDIKPANVMLTEDGQVKLLDFGVAKLLDLAGHPTAWPPAAPLASEVSGPLPEETVDVPRTLDAAPDAEAQWPSSPQPTGLVGTPLYMAPEVWRGEPATARSDLYSLGVLLYELCSGQVPHPASTREALREAVLHQPYVPLERVAPEVQPAFASVVSRLLAREPAERFPSAEALREALEGLDERAREEAGPLDHPFPGLVPFSAGDRAIFFGRASQIRAVLERLRSQPLVLVAGDSGVGKSSLCRAGVLPRVAEGALGPGAAWNMCELLPGRQPLRALAAALAPALGCLEAELWEELRQAPTELGRRARAASGGRGLLVFVDQLEELMTLAPPEEAERFALALSTLVSDGAARLLATARGDFLAKLAALPLVSTHLSAGLYLLPHLGEAGLREAIVGPARAQGFSFESEAMVETLVAAGRAEGALPLLQFALAELWERRDRERRVVPAEALVALGGVEGALARYADGVLAELRPGPRFAARRLLSRLVLAEGTRARRTSAELLGGGTDGNARAALEALVRSRLILARESSGGKEEGTYELAHEVLLRGWATLRGWLASDEAQRALRQRLERACAEWERLGRVRELLWRAPQLAEVKQVGVVDLSPGEELFLQTSRRAVWRRRLASGAAVLLSIPLALALGYAGITWRARRALERDVATALALAKARAAEAHVEDERVEALRRQSFSLFDEGRDEVGDLAERSWAEALKHADREDQLHREAAQALEAVLLRDPHQGQVRRALGEALVERIRLAERDSRSAERAALLQRLSEVDEDGALRARLERPARLSVESEPPGAELRLERAVMENGGRLRWQAVGTLGKTPLVEVALPPGSYRLVVQLPDRPAVLYPVLLSRGERFLASVPLPESVPEGFVYIPPGRFLSGSIDDEHVRLDSRRAPPLHELTTGGYFISRTEVTYANWLTFLRSRPAGSSDRRHEASNQFGEISLMEHAGQFEFTLKRQGVVYRAKEGEPVRYLDRDRRVVQDWLRFLVSGITWKAANDYVHWLATRRGLPSARLCDAREWERAARGADGRAYPHGNRLDFDDANFDQTYGRQSWAFGPDMVGAHPASESPFGLMDMAGNVWEFAQRVHLPDNHRNKVLIAGGSFYQPGIDTRTFNYGDGEPFQHDPLVGLRVCASPVAP